MASVTLEAIGSLEAIKDMLAAVATASRDTWSAGARRWLVPGDGPEYASYDFTGTVQDCLRKNQFRKALRWVEFNIPDGCNHRTRTEDVIQDILSELDSIENKDLLDPFRWVSEPINEAAENLQDELLEVVDYLDGLIKKANLHVGRAHPAHLEKLFPLGLPKDQDLTDAIVRLDTYRTEENSDRDILLDFLGPDTEEVEKMQTRIRSLRQKNRTTLPGR